MITREEALKEFWAMYPDSLATEKGYYNTEKLLYKLYDSFEQHIKSLEIVGNRFQHPQLLELCK